MSTRIWQIENATEEEREVLLRLSPKLEELEWYIRVGHSAFVVLDETVHIKWKCPRDLAMLIHFFITLLATKILVRILVG
ncbi:hypothetical protein LCGC14_1298330 [marine sediment metagenome]|uniref:Uncharacterized protein n=1 Tax=marine sediment metagenome TaxID=412755 RepID=A0A0F9KQQ9_9ZZZZ